MCFGPHPHHPMNYLQTKLAIYILAPAICMTGCVSRSDYGQVAGPNSGELGNEIGLLLILSSEFFELLGWAGDKSVVKSPPLPKELTMTFLEYKQMDTSARKGDPVAQYALGLCYAKGKAVVKDEAVAADWYRQSAGQGYGPAFVNLSDCYAQGAGVIKDQVEAYAYARLASEVGAVGPQRLVEMEGRLTPLEVVAGSQRALSLWSELMLKAKSAPMDEVKR